MILSVDQASPVPPFEQMRAQITSMIASGALKAGDRLPSIRQLAIDLDLAPGTVSRAVRELEQDGLLLTRGRHGTFVTDRPARVSANERERLLNAAAYDFALTATQLDVDAADAVASVRDAIAGIKKTSKS